MKREELAGIGAVATILIAAAWRSWLPLSLIETLGFVTGAVGVWLTVRENIWNWPIGIANSAFYVVVFFGARLYADMTLQVIYVILGALGWYWWLRGGENRDALRVSRASPLTLLTLGSLVVVVTAGMTLFLRSIGDAAPFLDALTTTLSLAAQYLLTRKFLENWLVWITADVLYIGLYIHRELYLTAGLYALFMGMCVLGLWRWRQVLAARSVPVLAVTMERA